MPLANRKQTPQLCSQAVSQVSILIVARHHPDCRATQSWCSTRGCRSMPTPPAYIAIQSTGARFGSLENCLVFSAAMSSAFCRGPRA